jgi:hypothetical protein
MNQYNVVCLFCEDIREETNEKYSLVGVFPDNVNVGEIPSAFPKLGIYARFNLATDFEIKEFSFNLRLPNGETIKLLDYDVAEIKTEQQKAKNLGAPFAGFIFRAMASPAPIPAAGRMFAVFAINGEEIIAGHLNIQLPQTT